MATSTTSKSGKGTVHGVVSELSATLTVREGHEAEMRAAITRFIDGLRNADPRLVQKIGLRTMRHVLFDNDRRLMWLTSFETEWDPYIDDAIELVGLPFWAAWLQHTTEFRGEMAEATNADIKEFLQSAQVQAASFYDCFADETIPQVRKALRVDKAFQQVLDDPAAEEHWAAARPRCPRRLLTAHCSYAISGRRRPCAACTERPRHRSDSEGPIPCQTISLGPGPSPGPPVTSATSTCSPAPRSRGGSSW